MFSKKSELFSKVIIQGKIINQPEFVYSLGERGQYGFDVYLPFETIGRKLLLIRAGWTKEKFNLETNFLNTDKIIHAILLKPKRKNLFTPDNSNELTFYIDLLSLEKKYSRKLYPLIAESTSDIKMGHNLKKPEKIVLPNNHLQYALTWYSLCFVIIIAFLIYKKKI